MSIASINDSIRQKYATAFASGANELPTIYPNSPQNEPPNPKNLPKEKLIWAALTLPLGTTVRADIGTGTSSRRYRTAGAFIVQLFGPLGEGEELVLAEADKIIAEFLDQTVNGVQYRSGSINVVGRSEAWWQVNVTVPWISDTLA